MDRDYWQLNWDQWLRGSIMVLELATGTTFISVQGALTSCREYIPGLHVSHSVEGLRSVSAVPSAQFSHSTAAISA